jgi:signal transduction histidine kinase
MDKGVLKFVDGLFYVIDTTNGLSENQIMDVLHVSKEEIWVGTKNQGVNIIYNNKIAELNTTNGLVDNHITYLFLDDKDRMWVGTQNGISIVDGNTIANIGQQNGIISNKISSIAQNSNHEYWIASTEGLTRLTELENNMFEVQNFNNNMGAYMANFSRAVVALPEEKMLWENNHKMVAFEPENEAERKTKPRINIDYVKVGEKNLDKFDIKNEIEIGPQQNFVISFPATDWGYENEIRYDYLLFKQDNISDTWIKLGKNHILNLSQKSYGKYKLVVRANGYYDSDFKELSLVFIPPWWMALWAKLLWVFLFLSAIGSFVFYRLRRLERQKLKLQQQVDERTEEIMLQKIQLEQKNAELQQLDKFKQTTTSMLVHDLKNPLNLILNYSMNKNVRQVSYSMLNIILNILDVIKSNKTQIKLNRASHNLVAILDDSLKRTDYLFEQKNLKLKTNIEHTGNLLVDSDYTIRVFENLFTNAIKYSPQNKNVYFNSSDFQNYIKIEIRDEGEGIDNEVLENVYKEYVQNRATKSGIVPSTGLGLAFCKMAVEKQNGKIEIVSKKNEGTSVIVYFEKIEKTGGTNIKDIHIAGREFVLSMSDKQVIKPIAKKLSKTEIYEISVVLNLIKTAETKNNDNINQWLSKVKTAAINSNQELYQELINEALYNTDY